MTVRNGLKSIVLVFVFVFSIGPVVSAEEEPDVIKALYGTFAELGGERPTHQSLTTDADGTVTVTGLKVLMQNFQQGGEDVRQELTAGEMVLRDVKTVSEGLYEAGTMTMKNVVVSVTTPEIETLNSSMPVIEAKGAFIRSPDAIKTNLERMFARSVLARHYSIPLMTVNVSGFTLDLHDLKYQWNGDPKTFMGETIYSVGSMELPAATLDKAGMKPSLKELGYDKLVFGMTGRANMQMPAELIEMDGESGFLARDMGAFSMSGTVGGIQPKLFEAAQAVQEAPNSIDVTAMMAMTQTITIGHMKLRYDDASLAERLLSYFEKSESKSREQIVTETTALSDFGMAGLGSPELSAQAKAALKTFLTKPGWIQFELRPDAPVSVNKIMQMLGTPAEIVKLLKIEVTAGARSE